MKIRHFNVIIAVSVLPIIGCLFMSDEREVKPDAPEASFPGAAIASPDRGSGVTAARKTDRETERGIVRPDTSTDASHEAAEGKIAATLDVLLSGDAAARTKALDQLEGFFLENEPRASIAAILGFLNSRQDAETGEPFAAAAEGALAKSPSLRVFLLDQLGLLCRDAHTDEALHVSRGILRDFSSPEEWAIALRNAAWLAPKDVAYLQERVTAMLGHQEWLENAGPNLIEAFRVACSTTAPAFIPKLSEIMANPDDDNHSTATETLEILSATNPSETARVFNDNPDLLGDKPLFRADLLARANLADNADRAQVERYLDRTDVSVPEKDRFLSSLLTSGTLSSNDLLTPVATESTVEEEAARFTMLRKVASEWLGAGKFPELRTGLQALLADPEITALIATGRGTTPPR